MLKNVNKTAKLDGFMGQILELVKNGTNKERVLASIRSRLSKKEPFLLVTPNPEIILLASKDKNFGKILINSDYKIADGIGILAALDFLNLKRVKNIPLGIITYFFQGIGIFLKVLRGKYKPLKGREMFLELLGLANKLGYKVFFVGGDEKILNSTKEILERSYKRLRIKVSEGPILNRIGMPINFKEEEREDVLLSLIRKERPEFLFVGFGAPKQEYWLERNIKGLGIKGAMAVGGTFDYIGGGLKLPPVWMENAGLEWLYRLVQEPLRLRRILNAVFVFPLRIYGYKLGI